MGSKISIDKHVSNLEDILEMNPRYFFKLKFDNKIPDNITQHIKVISRFSGGLRAFYTQIWKFQEDQSKKIRSAPISLHNFQTSG